MTGSQLGRIVDMDEFKDDVDKDGEEVDEERIEEAVERLADRPSVTQPFNDIRVTYQEDAPAAWIDMETADIFINMETNALETNELVNHLPGILAHEKGHVNNHFQVPGSMENDEDNRDAVKRRIAEHVPEGADLDKLANYLLNIVYDMEIHYQYLEKGQEKPSMQRKIQDFINTLRNKAVEEGAADSLLLSKSIQETREQEKVKEVFESRDLSAVDKAVQVAKIKDFDEDSNGQGQGQGQGQGSEEDNDEDNGQGNGDTDSGNNDNDGGSGDSGSGDNSSDSSQSPGQRTEGGEDSDDSDGVDGDDMDSDGLDGDEEAVPGEGGEEAGSQGQTQTLDPSKQVQPFSVTGKPGEDADRSTDTTDVDNKQGVDISDAVQEKRKRDKVKNQLQKLGMDPRKALEYIQEEDISKLEGKISTLDNVLEDVIPALQSRKIQGRQLDRTRPGGDTFDGYRSPRDVAELVDTPEELLTVGELGKDQVKVERKSHTKGQSGVVFIVRDTSGSMTVGSLARMARDATVSLIKTAQKEGHDVGVVDFSGSAYVHKSSEGEPVTKDYHKLMVESMELKGGGGTDLSSAVEKIDEVIQSQEYSDVPVNVYIITDSMIKTYKDFEAENVKVNAVWTKDLQDLSEGLQKYVEKYNGEVYKTEELSNGELVGELYHGY